MDKLGKAIFAIILAMMVALFIFSLALRDIPMGELLLSLITVLLLLLLKRQKKQTDSFLLNWNAPMTF